MPLSNKPHTISLPLTGLMTKNIDDNFNTIFRNVAGLFSGGITSIVLPSTSVINELLYSTAANTIGGLATVNAAVLTTSSTGVPTWLADLPFSNLTQGSALSVLGVTGNATADVASIAAGTDHQVLRRSGTTLAFGAVNLASSDAITGDLPFANLTQGSALSVLGVTGNATADHASIAAASDHQVMRRSGTAVAFGAVNLAQSAAVTGELPLANVATLTAGTYTPTRSAEANLDANVTMFEAQYLRVGATVTLSGRFTADPTLTATATSFEMTLPIASNIGAVEDLAGVAFCGAIAGMGAQISGSVANNTMVVAWISSDVTAQSWSFTAVYQVI